ncbi:hypothetical protein PS3A_61700 [Pseudomonas sp. 3A(2025)]
MRDAMDFMTILRRHFPVFIGAFFLALFALSATLIMLLELYPPTLSDYGKYMVIANLGLSVYLCSANFLVIRGRPWGIWPVVVAMVACILVVGVHWGQRGVPLFMYVAGLLLPLLTLLMLNSKRHREMREAMVQVRLQRQALRHKARRK